MVKLKVESSEENTEHSLKRDKIRGGGLWRGHVSTTKFTGNCASLSDHIYNIGHGQADRYMKTTNAIAKYVGEEYAHGSGIRLTIDTLELPII